MDWRVRGPTLSPISAPSKVPNVIISQCGKSPSTGDEGHRGDALQVPAAGQVPRRSAPFRRCSSATKLTSDDGKAGKDETFDLVEHQRESDRRADQQRDIDFGSGAMSQGQAPRIARRSGAMPAPSSRRSRSARLPPGAERRLLRRVQPRGRRKRVLLRRARKGVRGRACVDAPRASVSHCVSDAPT